MVFRDWIAQAGKGHVLSCNSGFVSVVVGRPRSASCVSMSSSSDLIRGVCCSEYRWYLLRCENVSREIQVLDDKYLTFLPRTVLSLKHSDLCLFDQLQLYLKTQGRNVNLHTGGVEDQCPGCDDGLWVWSCLFHLGLTEHYRYSRHAKVQNPLEKLDTHAADTHKYLHKWVSEW